MKNFELKVVLCLFTISLHIIASDQSLAKTITQANKFLWKMPVGVVMGAQQALQYGSYQGWQKFTPSQKCQNNLSLSQKALVGAATGIAITIPFHANACKSARECSSGGELIVLSSMLLVEAPIVIGCASLGALSATDLGHSILSRVVNGTSGFASQAVSSGHKGFEQGCQLVESFDEQMSNHCDENGKAVAWSAATLSAAALLLGCINCLSK